MEKLWDAILRSVRIQGDGTAVSAWRQHLDTLGRRKDLLNKYHFKYLHYTNSLGTDLTIQLPEDHLWAAGNSRDEKRGGVRGQYAYGGDFHRPFENRH